MSSEPGTGGGGSAGPSSTTWRSGEAVRGVPSLGGGGRGVGVAPGDVARSGAVGPSCLEPGERGTPRHPLPPAPARREREAGGRGAAAGEGRGRFPGARGAQPGRGSVAFLVSVLVPLPLSSVLNKKNGTEQGIEFFKQ